MKSKREEFEKLKNIWYKQSYKDAIDKFKGMSREKILEICKIKEDSYDMDLDKWDPEDNNAFEDDFKLVLNGVEAEAYRNAATYILRKGSIN